MLYFLTRSPNSPKATSRFPRKINLSNKAVRRFIFSQPEILVAIAIKEKSYTDASITLELRLMKLILLIKSNWEILRRSL